MHSLCQWCDVCVRPTEARPLRSDGGVLTKVQMKAGGSQGHRQTAMKQQCDLQLAGLIVVEQRSPHETLTSLEKKTKKHFTAFPNIGIHVCELNREQIFIQMVKVTFSLEALQCHYST